MIWLDVPYNTLEIHTLRIFLSSSNELWCTISLRPVRHILPIIPYLDNFISSPMLGLISLNQSCGRPINSTSGSIWTKWDHGWVEKTTTYNIPMCCGHFLEQSICGGHYLQQSICVARIFFNKESRPLSSLGASFSLLGGHFSVAMQIWLRGTFGRLIYSYWNTFWSG